MTGTALTWDTLTDTLAEVTPVPPEEITREARIVEDLFCDSLALAELVVVLIDDFDAIGIVDRLEQRGWTDLRAGDLLEEALASRADV